MTKDDWLRRMSACSAQVEAIAKEVDVPLKLSAHTEAGIVWWDFYRMLRNGDSVTIKQLKDDPGDYLLGYLAGAQQGKKTLTRQLQEKLGKLAKATGEKRRRYVKNGGEDTAYLDTKLAVLEEVSRILRTLD